MPPPAGQPAAIAHYHRAAAACADLPQVGEPGYEEYLRRRQARFRDAIDRGDDAVPGYSDSTTELFRRLAPRTRRFVDAGAELGFYTCLAMRLMPADARILAVEPEPAYADALRRLAGGDPRVAVLPAAASDRAGSLTLHKPRGCSSTAAAVDGHAYTVDAVTLDDLLADDPPDLVKIDVEGAEAAVLRGMSRLLARGDVSILLEYHPWVEQVEPGATDAMARQLQQAGYRILRLDRPTPAVVTRPGGRMYLQPPRDRFADCLEPHGCPAAA